MGGGSIYLGGDHMTAGVRKTELFHVRCISKHRSRTEHRVLSTVLRIAWSRRSRIGTKVSNWLDSLVRFHGRDGGVFRWR